MNLTGKTDGRLRAPVLALGSFERVGSNWFSSALAQEIATYNEPFRQQLHSSSPFSTLSAIPASGSAQYEHPYSQHWMRTFVGSKYTTVPTVVKETNLFFALNHFLALFSDAPILLLTRNVIGIAGSFQEEDLYSRWNYSERYRQLSIVARTFDNGKWRFALPDDDSCDLTKLVRMMTLNALLIATNVQVRFHVAVPYELAILEPTKAAEQLQMVDAEIRASFQSTPAATSRPALNADNTFSPYLATSQLIARLTTKERDVVSQTLTSALERARQHVHLDIVEAAGDILQSHPARYTIEPPADRDRSPRSGKQQRSIAPKTATAPAFIEFARGLHVKNYLVTNDEFCLFLNQMRDANLDNLIDGVQLLALEEMPPARGGRIHFNSPRGVYQVLSGYGSHPVYWVTWLGAAAFARSHGARLPRFAEVQALIARSSPTSPIPNVAFRLGDVSHVAEAGRRFDEIHHTRGNLQVWCEDGPRLVEWTSHALGRFYAGAAWNSPGTERDMSARKVRHIAAASRGIGIRLVRDNTPPQISCEPDGIAARILHALAHIDPTQRNCHTEKVMATAAYGLAISE